MNVEDNLNLNMDEESSLEGDRILDDVHDEKSSNEVGHDEEDALDEDEVEVDKDEVDELLCDKGTLRSKRAPAIDGQLRRRMLKQK